MSIQQFYNTAIERDFARQFQFRLERLADANFGPDDLVYVETASLPGRSITNIPVNYMGMQFNTPGTATYPGSDAWRVQFRCDANYNIRKQLEDLTFSIFDDETSTGSYGVPGRENTIIMSLLGKEMEPVAQYVLHGAWVKSIEESAYDIKDTGTVQTVVCTLAYQFWRPRIAISGGNEIKTQYTSGPWNKFA